MKWSTPQSQPGDWNRHGCSPFFIFPFLCAFRNGSNCPGYSGVSSSSCLSCFSSVEWPPIPRSPNASQVSCPVCEHDWNVYWGIGFLTLFELYILTRSVNSASWFLFQGLAERELDAERNILLRPFKPYGLPEPFKQGQQPLPEQLSQVRYLAKCCCISHHIKTFNPKKMNPLHWNHWGRIIWSY